ncbi:MAG TPA: hypothetical protein VK569_05295, partial [Bacteroidota bacterium]|nr:hypothetical protein [Bacteroidota bacterium]
MKRRDFIKTPLLGAFLPGLSAAEVLESAPQRNPESAQANPGGALQRLHPDFVTYQPGMEYFYLGNGDIQGAVQFSPGEGEESFIGFTLMDPENFCRKWSTFLFSPERGFTNTRLGVVVDNAGESGASKAGMYPGVRGFSVARDNFVSIAWEYPEGVPVVALAWNAGECAVREEFFVPREGALLFRRVTIENRSAAPLSLKLSLSLYANFGLFTDIRTDEKSRMARADGLASMSLFSLDPRASVYGRYDVRADIGRIDPGKRAESVYVYAIKQGEQYLRKHPFPGLWKETAAEWAGRNRFETGNALIDRLYAVSRTELRSVISRSGRMDAGTWMYNMEWLGDHAMASEALLRSGFVNEAKLLLEKNLRDSIGPDGRTVESGRFFGYDYTEIVQNGIMLFAVWNYVCWTGDTRLLRKYWPKIRLCGDFPLEKYFLDPKTHLVHNKREFWERSDSHGIEDGFELAYQFWVSYGLGKGAALARLAGDPAAGERWEAASGAMRETILNDPVFRFIEDGHLIKRRTRDGRWQKEAVPPDRGKLPAGSPIAVEEHSFLDPDTITVLPILFEMVPPGSPLASATLRWVDTLWNQRWEGGGYPRYNVSGEDNPPAPWPLASMLVARASAAAGEYDRLWRILEWLDGLAGRSGSWFERCAQSITPPMP